MAAPEDNENCFMCKTTPKGARLNFKKFMSITWGVTELLRKVSQGGRIPPPGQVGLIYWLC